MPVLVIQGSKDRMVCSNAVMLLLQKMHSQDQTVRWFSDRGHLLLETSYVRPETLDTLNDWLDGHMKKNPIAKTAQTAAGKEVNQTD
jgi:esterase/lipase